MTNKMQLCRIIYYSLAALRVSGDIFAHHQEHLNCITAPGITHVCRCQLVSWKCRNCWNMQSSQGIINYSTQLHLVGHFRILYHDYQVYRKDCHKLELTPVGALRDVSLMFQKEMVFTVQHFIPHFVINISLHPSTSTVKFQGVPRFVLQI